MNTARPSSTPERNSPIRPRLKYALWTAASLAVLSAAVGNITSVDAVAQTFKPLLIRSIDEPALQPFEATGNVFTAGGVSEFAPLLSVPAGKRLVIEYINATASSNDPTADLVAVTIRNPTTNQTYDFPGGDLFSIQGAGVLAISFPARIYVNPGSTLDVSFALTNAAGGDAKVTVSGHLVDLQ